MFRCFLSRFPVPLACLAMVAFLLVSATHVQAQADMDYRRWLDERAQRLLDEARRYEDKSDVGAEHAGRVRAELELQKDSIEREKRYSYPEPILSPDRRPIAAMVNSEYMTVDELNARIRAAMQGMKPIEHPDSDTRRRLNEDRVLSIANRLIQDWVMNKMLALQGRGLGYTVSESEVDAALEQLKEAQQELVGSGGGAASPATTIGIRESQLRDEIRDSLIIEKYINGLVDVQYKEEDYRRIYQIAPDSFRIPARVRAFHVFQPMPMRRDFDTLRDLQKKMEKMEKQLAKAGNEEMADLVKASIGQQWSAGDMGWVTSDSQTMQPQLMQGLFSTPVGKTSSVIQTRDGFHLVRVLEREEGSPRGLESAKPQIRNYLFAKTKYATYATLKTLYDIRYNTGGLMHWREVSAEELKNLRAGKISRPDLEDGITITELRREIEAEGGRSSATGAAPEPAASSKRTAAEPEAPTIDLSILQ